MTPSGVEPANFRFLAQHFKHCATAVPQQITKLLKKGNLFNYLETVLYEVQFDIDKKLNTFLIFFILNNVFRPKNPLKTVKLHNTLAVPVLLYGSETKTNKASDARRITAAEMKYMRRTAGYTGDRIQKKCTNWKNDLKITPILDTLLEEKKCCTQI